MPDIEMGDALRAADPSARQPVVDPVGNACPTMIEGPVPTIPGTACQPASSQVPARLRANRLPDSWHELKGIELHGEFRRSVPTQRSIPACARGCFIRNLTISLAAAVDSYGARSAAPDI